MAETLLESWTAGEAASPTPTGEKPIRTNHGEETPLLSTRREGDSSEGEVARPREIPWGNATHSALCTPDLCPHQMTVNAPDHHAV